MKRNSLLAALGSALLALAACESTPASTANPDVTASDSAGELGTADAAADTAADTAIDAATSDTASADSATLDATGKDSAGLDSSGQDAAGDGAADATPDALADTVADTLVDATPDVPSDIGTCKWDLSDSSPAIQGWTTLTITKGAGPCPPNVVCSWSWELDASGNIAKSMAGVASQAKMDAAEFGELQAFVGNYIFTMQMENGFTCPPPPTDIGISFTLNWQGKKATQDVTGCILGGGCNDPKSVYDLITKY